MTSYLINEVIEADWTTIENNLKNKNMTFNELRVSIEKYFDDLLDKSFIEKKYENLMLKIEAIFAITEKFVNSYKILCYSYNEYLFNFVEGNDSSDDTNKNTGQQKRTEKLKSINCLKQAFGLTNNLWETYEEIYYQLLQEFKKIPETRSLVFKFDFNLFHTINHERKEAKIYYQNLKEKNRQEWRKGGDENDSAFQIIEESESDFGDAYDPNKYNFM